MAEVVGTAWVRIRALTTGLAAEVNDAFDDVSKKVQPAAQKLGDKTGDTIGRGVKNGIQNNIGDGNLIDVPSIGNKVDSSGNRSIFTRIGSRFATAFHNALRSNSEKKKSEGDFQKFFNKIGKFKIPMKAWIGIIGLPGIVGATKAATYYIGGLVADVGSLVTQMVGSGAVIGAAFAEIAAGAGLLMLAFKVKTPELEAFQNGLKKIGEQWKGVVQETQKALFPQLNDALKTLTTKLLPVFKDLGKAVGEITGQTAKTIAAVATSGPALSVWSEFTESTKVMGVNLGRVGSAVAQILIPLFHTLIPLAQDFSDNVARLVEHWRDLIQAGNQSGGLQAFFYGAYLKSKQLMGALGDIVVGIWRIFQIGNTAGGFAAFDTFDRFAARFRSFTESIEGENKIRKFFEDARPVIEEVNGLIGDIFFLFTKGMETGSGSENIVNFIKTLRNDVLPGLAAIIADLSSSMSGVDFTEFAKNLGDFLAVAAKVEFMIPTLKILTIMLGALAAVLNIPIAGQLIGQILAAALAVGLLQDALAKIGLKALLPTLAEFFVAFIAGMLGISMGSTEAALSVNYFGASVMEFIVGPLATGLLAFAEFIAIPAAIIAAFALLYFIFQPFRDLIDGIWEDIQNVISLFTDGRWMDGIKAIGKLLLDVWLLFPKLMIAIYKAIFTGILKLVTNLPGWIASGAAALWGWIQDAIPMVLEKIGALIDIIEEFLSGLGGKIAGWVSGAAAAIWGWLQDAIPLAGEKIGAFFIALGGALETIGVKVAGWVAGAATALFSWIVDTIPKIPYYIGLFIGTIINQLIMTPIRIFQALQDAIPAMWSWITNAATVAGTKIAEWATSVWDAITGFVTDIPGHVADAASAIWGWLVDAVPMAAEKIGGWAQSIWDGFTSFITDIPEHLADAAVNLWHWLPEPADVLTKMNDFGNSILGWFTDLPGMIGDGISKLPDILGGLWDSFTNAVTNAGDTLLNLGSDIVNGIIDGVTSFISGAGDTAKNILSGFWDGVKDGLGPQITSVAETIWLNVSNFISEIPAHFIDAIAGFVGWLADAIPELATKWVDFQVSLWTAIASFIIEIPGKIIGAIEAITSWLTDAVVTLATKWVEFQVSLWTAIAGFIIELPGKIFGAIEAITSWLVDAAGTLLTKFVDFEVGLWGAIAGFIAELPGRIFGAIDAILGWIGDAAGQVAGKLGEFADKVYQWAIGFPDTVLGWLSGMKDTMLSIGGDIIQGIVDGISNGLSAAKDTVLGFLKDLIPGPIRKFLGISSPSKMTTYFGEMVAAGLALGIVNNTDMVSNAVDDLMKAATLPSSINTLGSGKLLTSSLVNASLVSSVPNVALTVKIGDRDITDIVDTQVDTRNQDLARQLIARNS